MVVVHALRAWYRQVRLVRATREVVRVVVGEAIANIENCIAEREKRLAAFLRERGAAVPVLKAPELACPLVLAADVVDLVAWVRALSRADAEACVAWLQAVEAGVVASAPADMS
jgi:hypothetical protein